MDKSKLCIGAIAVVGLAVIASHFFLNKRIDDQVLLVQYGQDPKNVANAPGGGAYANYVNPCAVKMAPRMYVADNPGSSPSDNPGESWAQGGGSSVTWTTGKWAA